jgi:dihydroneopterin aldolase
MRIGVWSEEEGISQRVRFTVELWVAPAAHRPGDLSSVVSYDFIVDGIKEIVAEGHVLLTETVAERVAAHCLSHRRAEKVRVVVEKLDRIPGASLGCEIVRFPARAGR